MLAGLQYMASAKKSRRSGYVAPANYVRLELQSLVRNTGREAGNDRQFDLLRPYGAKDVYVYCSGDVDLLKQPAVSIVGAREVSEEGSRRATKLARELAQAGIVVMSGLAKGVDTAAHNGCLNAGGNTIAVIGTPLNKAYPAENANLQTEIYNDHLLISPFAEGESVFRSNFPKRNRVMALLSDATVIVEASDTSGSLHQATECHRQGRWLFIMKSVLEDKKLTWPERFVKNAKTVILSKTEDIIDLIQKR